MALLDHLKYENGSKTEKRAIVVNAALELILSKSAGPEAASLSRELDNLSGYADKIQAALKAE